MRRKSGFGVLLLALVASCGGDSTSTAVVPDSIELSADRRTVTVVAYFPRSIVCAHQPGGLDVEVEGDIAVVTAVLERDPDVDNCILAWGPVTQSVTLAEPLRDNVRFEAPSGADPGCAAVVDGTAPTTTTTLDVAAP